jgi:hypothetical protein
MYKQPCTEIEHESELLPLKLNENTVIDIPRSPMKGVYSRFKTHNLFMKEPGVLEYRAANTAKVFTLVLMISAIVIIALTLAAKLPASFILGGIILLVVGIFSTKTWMESIRFCIDKESGTLSKLNFTMFMQERNHIFYLSDTAAVQLLAVELGDAIDVPVTTYEINLVYAIPPGQRTWLLSYGNQHQAREAAFQLGRFLDRPVLEHTAYKKSAR